MGLKREERALSAKKKSTDQTPKKGAKKTQSLNLRLIKGLSHPLRVLILAHMNEGPWSPRELERELGEGLSQVSYHVKVLNDYELIELVDVQPRRGAVEHYYKAIERAFIPSSMTKDIPKSAQRVLGDETLQNLDGDLRESLKSGKFYARDDWHASWTPVDLDDQGCKDAEKLADRFIEDLLRIEAQSVGRRAKVKDGGEHIAISAAVLVFGSEQGERVKAPSRRPTKRKKRANN
jgi:DNA-binding transcriptional ArsR family regulator